MPPSLSRGPHHQKPSWNSLNLWLWKLVSEPVRVALSGLWFHATRFATAGKASQALAVGMTIFLTVVLPIGLVITAMVPLSYTTGHPLTRVAWDLGLIVVMAEVVQVLPLILIPLSILTFHSLVSDTAERAEFYQNLSATR